MDSALQLESPRCRRCGASMPSASDGLCACCIFSAALSTLDEERGAQEAAALVLDKHQFPGYELLGEVARGAMGVVFRAKQLRPERLVALKVIASGELASPRMVERFRTEAETAARLEHPNIVPIFEVGREGHWHFFSMRLIEGPTLAQALNHRPIHPQKAAALMVKIARAVQYAHARGVLHRDIKPGNILLDANGEPHLTDFGLAKVLEDDSEITHSEAVLGTPAYMAPEQASGNTRDATTAVDIYALGAVLYEMLAGRPPFVAENTPALLRKIVEEEAKPPGALTNDELPTTPSAETDSARAIRKSSFVNPADLDAICLKCLEKNPAHRYHSAEQFADDLERALNGEPIFAQPSTATQRVRKWVRRNPAKTGLIATAVVALLAITVISLAFNVNLTRARNAAQASAEESRQRLITQHLRENATWNAAGDAFFGTWPLIEAMRIETDSSRRERIAERLAATFNFSPRLLHVWNAEGTPVELKFTADGRRLVAALRSGPARAWELSSGHPVPPPEHGERDYRSRPVISPDGTRVLQFFLDENRYGSVWNIESGKVVPLALNSAGGGVGAFSPDGKTVAIGGSQVRLWNADTGEQLPVVITNHVPCPWLMFTPDGSRLLTAEGNDRLWVWKLPSGERETNSIRAWHQIAPKFSPDGKSLLLYATSEVQVVNLETGGIHPSLLHNVMVFGLNFHPDGESFATASFVQQARVWNTASGNPGRPAIAHESGANHAVFSPDGTLLATAGFDYEVRLVRSATHRPVAPAIKRSALIESMTFSADGRLLAIGDASGVVQVWDLDTAPKPVLADGAGLEVLTASHDGSRTLVVNSGAVRLLNAATGEIQEMENATQFTVTSASFDRAGEVVAATSTNGVVLWNAATRRLMSRVAVNQDVRAIAFHGTELFTGNSAGALQRWNIRTGEAVGNPIQCGEPISLLRWSEDARWLAAGGRRSLQVFDAREGKRIGVAIQFQRREMLSEVLFTRDGSRFVYAAANDSIEPTFARLFELPAMRLMSRFGHGDGVSCVAFSPDEKLIATGGEDNVVRLWRAPYGERVSSELRHQSIVRGVLFSPDGHLLASGCVDGTLRLWDVERGEMIAPSLQLGGPVRPTAFAAAGTELFVAVGTNSTLWKVPLSLDVPANVEELATVVTGSRVDASLRATPLRASELAGAFSPLRARDAVRFAMPTDLPRWHRERAAIAEREGNWFAAIFHYERLATLQPLSESEQSRLATARERWDRR